jgi:hypothetical protein
MARNSDQLFKAGAAQTDITPLPGTLINGDFLPHRAIHIHDRLFVKALFMQRDATRLVLIVIDTCVLSLQYARELRLRIEKETGIPFQHIAVSTTHTHAAGSLSEVYLCGPDPDYSQWLPRKVVEVVQEAMQKAQPARIAFGSVMVPEHVLCRRYIMKQGHYGINPVTGLTEAVITNPFGAADHIECSAGPVDPEVGFIALKDMAGNWISILANYSLHYVGDWEYGTISADYFGEFARQLKEKLGATNNFVGIMSNGTSGDINCRDFQHPERYPAQPFQKSKLIAGDIAQRVVAALPQLQWEENPALAVQYEELQPGLRKPAASEIEASGILMAQTDYAKLSMNEDTLRRVYAREQVLILTCPDTINYPIQAFRIGQGIIGSISGEIFAGTGLQIKAGCPAKKYFTICLANGNAGYVPPAHEIELGGYETWLCRVSCLDAQAESLIRSRFIALLQRFD